jgi:hypothetical protein
MKDGFSNPEVREAVAVEVRRDGFDTCTEQDVLAVMRYGSVDEGTVGEEYDAALTNAILKVLDARGIQT